ncbi:MAG: hypothetical protein ABEJ08_01695 [Halobacteriaceae archaeon]
MGESETALGATLAESGASNVVVLEQTGTSRADEVCGDLLTATEPAATNLLGVTIGTAVDEWLSVWRSRAGDVDPARIGVVAAGDQVRRTATAGGSGRADPTAGVSIETVTDPRDLTGIGVSVEKFLDAWADAPGRIVADVDSVTALLAETSLERVFRFLHVLTGRFTAADAVAHFHLTRDAHDEETVATLLPLFDAVVEIEDDGSVTVRQD